MVLIRKKKRLALSDVIQSSGCAIIYLEETKMPTFDATTLKSLCPKRFDRYAYIPSIGASGGLLTIWNSALFTSTVTFEEQFALGINFTSTQNAHNWTLVNIYGPCQWEQCNAYTQ